MIYIKRKRPKKHRQNKTKQTSIRKRKQKRKEKLFKMSTTPKPNATVNAPAKPAKRAKLIGPNEFAANAMKIASVDPNEFFNGKDERINMHFDNGSFTILFYGRTDGTVTIKGDFPRASVMSAQLPIEEVGRAACYQAVIEQLLPTGIEMVIHDYPIAKAKHEKDLEATPKTNQTAKKLENRQELGEQASWDMLAEQFERDAEAQNVELDGSIARFARIANMSGVSPEMVSFPEMMTVITQTMTNFHNMEPSQRPHGTHTEVGLESFIASLVRESARRA